MVMQLVIVRLSIPLSLCLQWVWQVIMYSLPVEVMQVIPWFPSAWKRWTRFKFRSLGYLPVTTRLGRAVQDMVNAPIPGGILVTLRATGVGLLLRNLLLLVYPSLLLIGIGIG